MGYNCGSTLHSSVTFVSSPVKSQSLTLKSPSFIVLWLLDFEIVENLNLQCWTSLSSTYYKNKHLYEIQNVSVTSFLSVWESMAWVILGQGWDATCNGVENDSLLISLGWSHPIRSHPWEFYHVLCSIEMCYRLNICVPSKFYTET